MSERDMLLVQGEEEGWTPRWNETDDGRQGSPHRVSPQASPCAAKRVLLLRMFKAAH